MEVTAVLSENTLLPNIAEFVIYVYVFYLNN
jgi:hypothetical protein